MALNPLNSSNLEQLALKGLRDGRHNNVDERQPGVRAWSRLMRAAETNESLRPRAARLR